jgi:hypothetical protein
MSAAFPRRSVDEWLYRLEREPYEFDCVVEGRFDRIVVNWVLRGAGLKSASVVEIGDFEMPRSLFPGGIVDDGNRSRVIRLAELASGVGENAPVSCLVDRDTEALLPATRGLPTLEITTGVTLESLFLNEATIDSIGRLCGLPDLDAAQLLADATSICEEIYVARCADRELDLRAGALDPGPNLDAEGQSLRFDANGYHERYCLREGLAAHRDSYLDAVDRFRELRDEHPTRPLVHGGDLSRIVRSLLIARGVSSTSVTTDLVQRGLFAGVSLESVLADATIASIVDRARHFEKLRSQERR